MATRVIRPVAVNKKEQKGEAKNVDDTFLADADFDIHENETVVEKGRQVEETPKEQERKDTETKTPTLEDSIAVWGKGFSQEDYQVLNTKLEQFRKHYPMRTAMHQEALITYLKYAQRRDKAIEEGNCDDADKWGKLAAKQAQDAKINPSQLSLADLSNGISNVGKIVEAVEKCSEIIPILPQFVRQPRDEVDYTIWLFVQYCQRLVNMPESTYSEIYSFVNEKYKINKKDYEFLIKEENKHYKEPI